MPTASGPVQASGPLPEAAQGCSQAPWAPVQTSWRLKKAAGPAASQRHLQGASSVRGVHGVIGRGGAAVMQGAFRGQVLDGAQVGPASSRGQ